ncbi:MAG: hypothetical protein ACREMY_31115, partial [bacterium]
MPHHKFQRALKAVEPATDFPYFSLTSATAPHRNPSAEAQRWPWRVRVVVSNETNLKKANDLT